MGIVTEVAARYAAAGYFTVIDGIVIPGWFLEPVRDALHAAGTRSPLPFYAHLCRCASRAYENEKARPAPISGPVEQIWKALPTSAP